MTPLCTRPDRRARPAPSRAVRLALLCAACALPGAWRAAFAAPAGAAAGGLRPMTPEDQLALKDIGEVQVSPDGSRVLYQVRVSDVAGNRTVSRLTLVPAAGGAATELGAVPEGAGNVRFSPDGGRIAFIAGKEGKQAVFVLDLATQTPTRVCDYDRADVYLPQAGSWLAWSPDGKQIAFSGTVQPSPGEQDPLVVTRLQYKTRTGFADNRRNHVHVVAAAGGAPRALTAGRFDEHSIDWGGDGREIIFLSNRAADPDVRHNYDIHAVAVTSGKQRQITRTPGVEMYPRVSPDGKLIVYTATTREITTIDSIAEDAHVFVVASAGGAPRELNRTLDRRSSAADWTGDGRAVVYAAGDHGKTLLLRVPANGGDSVPLFDRRVAVSPVAVSRADGSLVFAMSGPTAPRELYRLPSGAAEPVRLTSLNLELGRKWRLVEPETIAFKSPDGTDVEGWLYPAIQGREKGGRTPLILSIHGGPHGMYGYGFNPSFQIAAGRGYATLALNPRGSSGYGQRFSDGCVGDWGGGDYRDLMAGVDHALRTHPEIDGGRLGVTGGSYGGFMTNWVITQTDRFKGAVSGASLANLVSFYATSLYQDLVHAEFGGFPWDSENFATLWKWSPLAHVKKARTPTLFIHGERDNDVHITQAEEMFTALRRRGVEAALARYPREGHGFREPKHILDRTVRTLDWFDRHVRQAAGRGGAPRVQAARAASPRATSGAQPGSP